jgi:signal transduction histidine kinase
MRLHGRPRIFFNKAWREYRGLKGKIFLALAVTVLSVIISTFLVLNYFLRRQAFDTLHFEMQRAAELFSVLQQVEHKQMLEKGKLLASAPHLKAALDTGDPLSVQIVLEQLLQNVSATMETSAPLLPQKDNRAGEGTTFPSLQANNKSAPGQAAAGQATELCQIYDREGRIFSTVKRMVITSSIDSDSTSRFNLPDSVLIPALLGKERFAAWQNRDGAWRGVLVPILAGGSPFGPSVIGALALGTKLDDAFARRMKNLVGAEVAFLFANQVVAASLPEPMRHQAAIAASKNGRIPLYVRPEELVMENENFLIVNLPLFEDAATGRVCLLQSIDRAVQPLLSQVERTLFFVGFGAFLAALSISLIVSRTITHPIARLVGAAHAASAGQLDEPIRISSRDEIGYLAQRFEEMRQSIKQQMEKLTELNANLSERNLELESALDQLRRAQEELVKSEKLAAAGKLTAQLSHEINNPIHNIRSCLETALKKMPAHLTGREFVRIAHDEILRIGKLVRQMLDFYRFGQAELRPIDLNAALSEVLQSSQRRLEERRIAVERRLSANLPPVRASRDQMKQVFLNLILNGVEAMPGGGKLEVKSWRENSFVKIAICDTGCGIPPENLPKIFDPFFTTKRAVHGVGLGLSVCYNIVHQHGGTIEVESEVGKGSTFTVKLPVAEKMEQTS